MLQQLMGHFQFLLQNGDFFFHQNRSDRQKLLLPGA
jgi:hypothetical protein